MNHGRKITSGQNVHRDKLAFAKQLRREMTPTERRLWKALQEEMRSTDFTFGGSK